MDSNKDHEMQQRSLVDHLELGIAGWTTSTRSLAVSVDSKITKGIKDCCWSVRIGEASTMSCRKMFASHGISPDCRPFGKIIHKKHKASIFMWMNHIQFKCVGRWCRDEWSVVGSGRSNNFICYMTSVNLIVLVWYILLHTRILLPKPPYSRNWTIYNSSVWADDAEMNDQ